MENIIVMTENQMNELIEKVAEKAWKTEAHNNKSSVTKDRLTTKEACEILSVTPKTLWTYRTKGMIAFSQIGSKIYYKYQDLMDLLDRHYIPRGFNTELIDN
jgi:hypothetical protein